MGACRNFRGGGGNLKKRHPIRTKKASHKDKKGLPPGGKDPHKEKNIAKRHEVSLVTDLVIFLFIFDLLEGGGERLLLPPPPPADAHDFYCYAIIMWACDLSFLELHRVAAESLPTSPFDVQVYYMCRLPV